MLRAAFASTRTTVDLDDAVVVVDCCVSHIAQMKNNAQCAPFPFKKKNKQTSVTGFPSLIMRQWP